MRVYNGIPVEVEQDVFVLNLWDARTGTDEEFNYIQRNIVDDFVSKELVKIQTPSGVLLSTHKVFCVTVISDCDNIIASFKVASRIDEIPLDFVKT